LEWQIGAFRYSATTVTAVMKLLSLLLADAAEERLISANPIRAYRRGRRRSERRTEPAVGHRRRGARDRRPSLGTSWFLGEELVQDREGHVTEQGREN